MREALRKLREMHLVGAEHGVGTRVLACTPPADRRANCELAVPSLAEWMRYDGPTRLAIQEERLEKLEPSFPTASANRRACRC